MTDAPVPLILSQLTRAATKVIAATATRDDLMVTASQAGCSLRDLARATGLSHTKVKRILDRAE